MLGFLRRLRRSLIEEGHLKKYFVYALGEILLVVLGILIALQINNWNEERKSDREALELLLALKSNTNAIIQDLQRVSERERDVLGSIDIVIDNLSNTKIYNDTLEYHFIYMSYLSEVTWKTGAYETLKSKGLDLISNDSLREKIVDLYETHHQRILVNAQDASGYLEINFYPLFSKHFRVVAYDDSNAEDEVRAFPTDYAALVQSNEYVNMLSVWRLIRGYNFRVQVAVIEQLRSLNEMISMEIDNL